MRSQIHPAPYNPRTITDEGRKLVKRSIKQYGVVGGIVINAQTDNTIVGGHQKVYVLDELHKYDPNTNENDYLLRVEVVDVDPKTEKELNVTLNNGNVGGQWDFDALRQLIPDIDYKAVGFDEADLSMIGVDYILQTQEQNDMFNDIDSLMAEVHEQNRQQVEQRKQERLAARQEQKETEAQQPQDNPQGLQNIAPPYIDPEFDREAPTNTPTPNAPLSQEEYEAQQERERQAKIDHMKEVKQQVKDQATEKAQNMEAYVVLSFDDFTAKSEFCMRFGFGPYEKFIKGELFDEMVERIDV